MELHGESDNLGATKDHRVLSITIAEVEGGTSISIGVGVQE
ncbi:MAG: hypothetical protein AAB853_05185 [Patescibacteria group bacterium]